MNQIICDKCGKPCTHQHFSVQLNIDRHSVMTLARSNTVVNSVSSRRLETDVIKVLVTDTESGKQLAHIDIERLDDGASETANYSVRFGVEKGGSVAVHQRGVLHFPHRQFNSLALLLQALKTLDDQDLAYDPSWDDFVDRAKLNLSKIQTLIQENLHDE